MRVVPFFSALPPAEEERRQKVGIRTQESGVRRAVSVVRGQLPVAMSWSGPLSLGELPEESPGVCDAISQEVDTDYREPWRAAPRFETGESKLEIRNSKYAAIENHERLVPGERRDRVPPWGREGRSGESGLWRICCWKGYSPESIIVTWRIAVRGAAKRTLWARRVKKMCKNAVRSHHVVENKGKSIWFEAKNSVRSHSS
jgi:hypothetical protein